MPYHVRNDGTVAVCRAKVQACPLGGAHFDSPQEASQHFESIMENFLNIPTVLSSDNNALAIRPLRRDGKLLLSCFGCYMAANNPGFSVR